MINWRLTLALAGSLLLFGCSTAPQQETPPQKETVPPTPESQDFVAGDVRLSPSQFADLPVTRDEDWEQALKAFQVSCTNMQHHSLWREACRNAQGMPQGLARAFFEGNFELWKVSARDSQSGFFIDKGLMTGYFEPILRASRVRHGIYQYPIYGVPDDLITVELDSIHPQLKGLRLRGKLQGRKLVPYDDRKGIATRKDLEKKHVICWADDPVEAFFLQIQGSGRVLLDNGSLLRIGYADQNGHPYRSLGAWLIENAGLTRDEMSMQRIKQWVRDNPQRRQELLNANPNFVFFAERTGYSDDQGPVGAQGVPLTPLASVAVDRRYWKLGVPFVTAASQSMPAMQFVRPVIAQDTGGAIKGVLRFDYFWGLGNEAGNRAGSQKSDVSAWVMVPKGQSPAAVFSQRL